MSKNYFLNIAPPPKQVDEKKPDKEIDFPDGEIYKRDIRNPSKTDHSDKNDNK